MKLQGLGVIFLIVLVPIILLFSLYTKLQIDSINFQIQYDAILKTATYDSMKAYKTNTLNNKNVGGTDSVVRDIDACINAFMSTLNSGMGKSGYEKDEIKWSIPALVYILYDGYYIYAPTINNSSKIMHGTDNEINNISFSDDPNKATYEHILKPYIYYSVRYADIENDNNDVIVSYTLDNYITVYGKIDGSYVARAGYLEVGANSEGTSYKNIQIVDETAQKYYAEAYDFTNWVNNKLGSWITQECAKEIGSDAPRTDLGNVSSVGKIFYIDNSNDPLNENSLFSLHKNEIIKTSIQNNLNSAIASYNEYSKTEFRLPILNAVEWEQALSNISMISFMQGIPIGFKEYNGYAIVTNTTNMEVVTKDTVYFSNVNDGTSGTYHRINCSPEQFTETNLHGYQSYMFEKIIKNEDASGTKEYDYPEKTKRLLQCYDCIVERNETLTISYEDAFTSSPTSPTLLTDQKKQALYEILAKAKRESSTDNTAYQKKKTKSLVKLK